MTITPTFTEEAGRSYHHTWILLTADGDGEHITFPGAADRSVHVEGTFGGATVDIEGSNVLIPTASDWVLLDDTFDTALQFTATGFRAINSNMLHLRPRLSVVGAGATVNVHILSRSTMR